MKKIFLTLAFIFSLVSLSSCFLFGTTTIHPDMVEYTEAEVLNAACEKYSITSWIFTSEAIIGESYITEDGDFTLNLYDDRINTDFVGADNIEKAFSSFAGKNGGHDIQGRYRYFLCYYALGISSDGSLKFVFYNTNIHKESNIEDTIGSSNYTHDILPSEITEELFSAPSNWFDMTVFLNKIKNISQRGLIFSRENLTVRRYGNFKGFLEIEFYKENEKIVYDFYYTKDENKPESRRLVYSSSDRYGVIYNYYGADISQHFNISQTVSQSSNDSNIMELWGYVQTKPIDGTVLYSDIGYRATYHVMFGDNITTNVSNDNIYDTLSFDKGYGIEKIDGVNHIETAKFTIYDYYIFYEKNNIAE